MENKLLKILTYSLIIVMSSLFISCVDIKDDKSVIDSMQGTWVGYDHEAGIYTHYKLQISNTNFSGWIAIAYTDDEPQWASQPDEIGTFKLSPVQGYTNASGKYRNINFTKGGGGFGDNSLNARVFTKTIIFDEVSGLYVVRWAPMTRK